MKPILRTCLLLGIVCGWTTQSNAQVHTKSMVLDASSAVILPELGAVIKLENDSLVVGMVMPEDQRAEAYREVDLQEGDRLLMCNGKRVSKPEDLHAILDSVEVGGMIKLGLRREGHLQLASFSKADPKDLPGTMIMKQETAGPDGTIEKRISIGGGQAEGTVMVLDGGFVVGKGENGPYVLALLPGHEKKISGDLPQEGDLVLSINGELDTNIEAFQALYDEIPIGEKITVKLSRNGEELTATYLKSKLEGAGRMMIKTSRQ